VASRTSSKKVTSRLAAKARGQHDDDALDVVVELNSEPPATTGTRQEQIAKRKAAFEADAGDVKREIEQLGGEVVDAAWINQTIRGRVPKRSLVRLADHKRVAAIDSPSPLTPE
jgi:hypothetical protein